MNNQNFVSSFGATVDGQMNGTTGAKIITGFGDHMRKKIAAGGFPLPESGPEGTDADKAEAKSRPLFIEVDNKGREKVNPALLADYFREHYRYLKVQGDGNGKFSYYLYKNGVYEMAEEEFERLIMRPVQDYNRSLVKMSQIHEAFRQIKADSDSIAQDELDSDETVINFKNGLLRLSTDSLALEPHNPDVYSTIQLNCEWEGEGCPTPVFDAYLDTLTEGDKGEQELLLQFMGAALSNICGSRFKKALFMVGPGDSGKSQLRILTDKILGNGHSMAIDLQDLERRFGTGTTYGKRLIGSADMPLEPVKELKNFKRLTGGDNVMGEFKCKQAFNMRYKGLIWLCMNDLVQFGGDTGDWLYDRIMVVRCENVVPVEKRDKMLVDKMLAERTGIVYKAIKALQRAVAAGMWFSETEKTIENRKGYKISNSSVLCFFEECMCEKAVDDNKNAYSTSVVYQAYKKWCTRNRVKNVRSFKEFRTGIADYLGEDYQTMTDHKEHGTYFRYLTLTPEAIHELIG